MGRTGPLDACPAHRRQRRGQPRRLPLGSNAPGKQGIGGRPGSTCGPMGSRVSASQWGCAPLAEHEAGVGCPPSLSPQAHRVHGRVLKMSSQQLCGHDLCPAGDNACEAPGGTQAGMERSRPSARGRGAGGWWRETREQGRSGRLPRSVQGPAQGRGTKGSHPADVLLHPLSSHSPLPIALQAR